MRTRIVVSVLFVLAAALLIAVSQRSRSEASIAVRACPSGCTQSCCGARG